LRPIHPAIDACARDGISGPEWRGAMARRQIAKDGVRFPYNGIAVLNHGYTAMGIHRKERRRIEPAEGAAGIDMPVFKPEFADQPHHFLDVERTAPSPDFQHFRPPLQPALRYPEHMHRIAVWTAAASPRLLYLNFVTDIEIACGAAALHPDAFG
jgi:hypothetical protein